MLTTENQSPTLSAPRVALAPMAGVTDIPFRRQVKAFGGRYCVSEMVASEQLALARVDMLRRAAGAGVITPLVGVSEGPDREMTAPKVDLEIGG